MTTTRTRALAVLAGVLLPLTALTGPAQAVTTPGDPVAKQMRLYCPLERVADELVRCDDLTGNGVTAPGYVPEQ